jgi:hypothetical protein
MKYIFILTTFIILVSCKPNAKDLRLQNFPKAELIPNDLGKKENTWVFILAGQSNMAGRGFVEPQDTLPVERIITINKTGHIVIAKEPLHFYEPSMTGLDCGLSFGKSLLKDIPDSITILLIPTAVGGSSISQWVGDSTHRNVRLLSNFSEKVDIAKKYGIVQAVLWHQGENDANGKDVALYKERLQKLIVKFRAIIDNKNLPILIGELGSYSDDSKFWSLINEQIESYSSTDSNTVFITTKDLKDKGDKVHFNSIGQRLLGQRFASAYLAKKK